MRWMHLAHCRRWFRPGAPRQDRWRRSALPRPTAFACRLDYTKVNGERTSPTIEPYSVRRTSAGDHLLLFGVKADTGESRSYRLDRVQRGDGHAASLPAPLRRRADSLGPAGHATPVERPAARAAAFAPARPPPHRSASPRAAPAPSPLARPGSATPSPARSAARPSSAARTMPRSTPTRTSKAGHASVASAPSSDDAP
jgi:hypothetical protein